MLSQKQLINQAIEQQVLTAAQAIEEQLDEKLHQLENLNENDLDEIRRRRAAEIKRKANQREEWLAKGHGSYKEVAEKDFFGDLKDEERAIAHFYRSNEACKYVDKMLETLSKHHLEARFVKVQAEHALFLAERLQIKVLPSVICMKMGQIVDRLTGLDEVAGFNCTPSIMAARLSNNDMLMFDPSNTYGGEDPGRRTEEARNVRKAEYVRTQSDEDSDFGD